MSELPMLMNVEIVKWLRRVINPAGLERTLDRWGFPVDVSAYVEKLLPEIQQQFASAYPDVPADGVFEWIKNNFTYFLTGDAEAVTKSINDYLLLEPSVVSLFGYPITLYTDPAHLRQYALYLLIAFFGYKTIKAVL